jgi:hypothetical protein
MKRTGTAIALALALAAPAARAEAPAPAPAPTVLDRVVVRWCAPETGGPAKPQFVFERELAFEARLQSLADPDPEPGPYHERHVRAALDRHIGETLLAAALDRALEEASEDHRRRGDVLLDPKQLGPKTIAARAEAARAILEQQVHGRAKLIEAAAAEGIGSDELDALLRRQAKAGLYVDRMIAPMLEPDENALRDLLRTGSTPFRDMPFEQVAPALKQWYVGQRLGQAVDAFFQNARARVVISVARRLAPEPRPTK